ncbi:DUF72 domain-containing protein [bacterium]|nr:DUF72 domain-containing protein [FCB group bacterium]MBL7192279.1 DUF72 domain-containing protein [bacterium]
METNQNNLVVSPSSEESLILFGTSSFSSKDWVGSFYPEDTKPVNFLRYYAQQFNTVEIDFTYYAIPSPKTVASWAEKIPDDFLVAVKFPRAIVHAGEDKHPNAEALLDHNILQKVIKKFFKNIKKLGNKLGPMVLQFPYFNKKTFPTSEAFFTKLDNFLERLPKEMQYAVELRNRHWLNDDFLSILRKHNTAFVFVDQAWMPMPDEFQNLDRFLTADFCYIRLLGNRKEVEALTTTWEKEVLDRTENLERITDFLADLYSRKMRTYVYVNNHYTGHAPAAVRRLQQMFLDRKFNL